ncbi:NUDIX hydrolase domain-like protein, partial [Kalaharituber pfeilii]
KARTGRTKQRYAPDGSRLVCGVVAVSHDKKKILVVESTSRKNHWVLPKGGFETDEATPEDAALREAWEEAGITGKIVKSLGEIPDPRASTKVADCNSGASSVNSSAPTSPSSTTSTATNCSFPSKTISQKSLYIFFEVNVDKEEACWPEMHKRSRKWITYAEATKCFETMKRPELLEAVRRSSVMR